MDYKKQLQSFLKKKTNKQKLIVIYGPTGAGKTSMSIDIAKFLDTEIISTDSRQIFKYMDIGTGKITDEEMEWVPHHMLDIITPDKEYSVWEFQKVSFEIMKNLWSQNKIPMLVGGSGLYIDSLMYDWAFPSAPSDKGVRKDIESLSKDELYVELQKVDPEVAREIHPNNIRRVQRALEIYRITGKSKKEFDHKKILKYEVLFLTPDYGGRENLYNRINSRVQSMMGGGLLEEIQWLFEKGYTESDFGMQSIGYQEFFPYFHWEISLEEAVTQAQQASRNYAKRQLTWFSKYEKVRK